MRYLPDMNFAPECSRRAKNQAIRITEPGQDVAVAIEVAVVGGGAKRGGT
ncbi:MAG: hypothetical protein IBX54_02395 [Rhodoferax sp.]|nr:hypothetical protein [Rhodoferax sp.]